ncbi:hypothetical protein NHF48_022910 [Sphingomonas sp. H160509]|uniref:hypothetical protein n=1 Tax=Sphingomonas sp. H160509 TaxID=2955313 RepID=UPI0020983CEB|nr:hypothetical protein [Sphingomonas sp. H160509]MDD1453122.1 hypothetical protein [Sphingomonas sp. H160509]
MARIDGMEVTRRDILIELMASGAPADVDTQTVQPALLDRIIVRKLLAEEARRQSVDRSPRIPGTGTAKPGNHLGRAANATCRRTAAPLTRDGRGFRREQSSAVRSSRGLSH